MKRFFTTFIVIIILVHLFLPLRAVFSEKSGERNAQVYLSSLSGFLGDQVIYTVEIPLSENEIIPSDISYPRSSGLTFIRKSFEYTSEATSKKCIIEFWMHGYGIGDHSITLPPVEIHNTAEGTIRIVKVPDIIYTVKSMLGEAESVGLIENDTLIEVPRKIFNSVLVILILLFLAIILVALYFKINRSVLQTAPEISPSQNITPREYALQELAKLQKTTLLQEGKRKEFYSRLSTVIKQFLQMSFNIDIVDCTSSEIHRQLSGTIAQESLTLFDLISGECDLVKFAKDKPDYETIIACLQNTKIFFDSIEAQIKDKPLMNAGPE
jgi:hypothetical protein